MKPIIQRVLQAYRPLYLNGLLKDGRHLPSHAVVTAPAPSGRRAFLLALTRAAVQFPHRGDRS